MNNWEFESKYGLTWQRQSSILDVGSKNSNYFSD